DPAWLTNVGGTLFFAGDDGKAGSELWKSDGTAAGTLLVEDIDPGSKGSEPAYLTNVAGEVYFSASDGNGAGFHGTELWKSDGTATVMVKDINPGQQDSAPKYLNEYNGSLLFAADDGPGGYELWRSDGTQGETFMLKDINAHGSSFPIYFARLNPLFFLADDGAGFKLWRSDGTAEGTVKVGDVVPPSTGTGTGAGEGSSSEPSGGPTVGTVNAGDAVTPSTGTATGSSSVPSGGPANGPFSATPAPASGSQRTESGDWADPGAGLSATGLSGEISSFGLSGVTSNASASGTGVPAGTTSFTGSHTVKGLSLGGILNPGTGDTSDRGYAEANSDRATYPKSDPFVPSLAKVTLLGDGGFSIRSDMISLVVSHDMWLPPMAKWYLTIMSEGRYRPGSLPPGHERMIWDYLDFVRKRQAGDEPPLKDSELRLAWQWAEWRRQVIKQHGTSEVLPWNYFKGLSEAIMAFYGQKEGTKVEFSTAVNTLHQNVRNLTIIPLELPKENLPQALQESAVK
ncbi:MAG: ELWxxDGT repeat protein, partial [Pseudomonadota bacterium]